ncbi:ferric reductase-like transmembrane domain-containing protein [Tateyamaria sp. SN6-1]|uniref:ferric reductase-like transmembrane domain-containing protein n=1 Tax=Tateyamaria sp. SN6-1 TaxID=3092148 RepID=UPI0039F54182
MPGRALFWLGLALAMGVPVIAAAFSPQLAWRDLVYIAAGFAGIFGMALMLVQPVLAAGFAPGVALARARQVHRWTGALVLLAVVVHVAALWLTSPPDVIDALFFASPTPFAPWGVAAMWAVLISAALALMRKRIGLRAWRLAHTGLAVVVVVGTVVHVLLIEGTMETVSKYVLSGLLVAALVLAVARLRVWAALRRRA